MSRRLAIDLDARGQHEAAAVEYRRLALSADDAAEQAGYYWAAAYEYRRAGLSDLAARMLDRAEDRSPALRAPVALLRAETALDDGRAAEAEFHIATLIEGAAAPDETLRDFLARRLARARLLQGDVDGAAAALNDLTAPSDKARQSLARYRREHDRIPWIGGALGAVPGLGYAYSGEFANAARSLLLNGLFIFGMAHTAEREQWGAFAIISFFELTWYTGSIYGGMDAAHRHNRERLEACLTDIDGGAAYSADLGRLPLVSISFGF
ncbi:MAG: hypothetical protein FJ225_06810 [Lentisphaerae bacterium]|nr:hypothetical protein [Lentisphaerota bacterium]